MCQIQKDSGSLLSSFGVEDLTYFFYFCAAIMDSLITLKYWIFFFLISYREEFQPVKYYHSGISLSRNMKLQNDKFQISSHFLKFIVKKILKSFSGRNNSLEPSAFGFSDSFPCELLNNITSNWCTIYTF